MAAIAPRAHDVGQTTRSDANGHFRLAPLPAGRYGVTATAVDRTGGMALDVDVAAAGTTHTTITMGGEYRIVRGRSTAARELHVARLPARSRDDGPLGCDAG